MHVTPPPSFRDLLSEAVKTPEQLTELVLNKAIGGAAPGGKYRHWHTLRHVPPPEGLTHEQWWLAVKLARAPLRRTLPLTDADGEAFVYGMPDPALELLHYIDQHASGEIRMSEVVIGDESAQRQFLVNSLIEESIRSSQLEGATTSKRVAKEMIRSGRPPKNRSERMILNNYRALQFMRTKSMDILTPEFVLELHRILTEGTLDNPDAAGRLQLSDEDRIGVYTHDNELLHQPPPAEQLPGRLKQMCDFANGVKDEAGFLHPVGNGLASPGPDPWGSGCAPA